MVVCLAFLSVQLNISPNVVKQQRPFHGSFPRKDSFYTCMKETNSTICEVVSFQQYGTK